MAKSNAGNAISFVPGDCFCIHVTNLSSNSSGEELSKIFEVPVEYVLMDTMKNEAWIKNVFRKDTAETKARNHNGKRIDNQIIECRAKAELIHIAKLCSYFRSGTCTYGDKCANIHVLCKDPDKCSQNNCYYGHSRRRPAVNVDKIDYAGNINICLSFSFARFVLTGSFRSLMVFETSDIFETV